MQSHTLTAFGYLDARSILPPKSASRQIRKANHQLHAALFAANPLPPKPERIQATFCMAIQSEPISSTVTVIWQPWSSGT
jgi:hypothetical protein